MPRALRSRGELRDPRRRLARPREGKNAPRQSDASHAVQGAAESELHARRRAAGRGLAPRDHRRDPRAREGGRDPADGRVRAGDPR